MAFGPLVKCATAHGKQINFADLLKLSRFATSLEKQTNINKKRLEDTTDLTIQLEWSIASYKTNHGLLVKIGIVKIEIVKIVTGHQDGFVERLGQHGR